jgi:hypothetical protein
MSVGTHVAALPNLFPSYRADSVCLRECTLSLLSLIFYLYKLAYLLNTWPNLYVCGNATLCLYWCPFVEMHHL